MTNNPLDLPDELYKCYDCGISIGYEDHLDTCLWHSDNIDKVFQEANEDLIHLLCMTILMNFRGLMIQAVPLQVLAATIGDQLPSELQEALDNSLTLSSGIAEVMTKLALQIGEYDDVARTWLDGTSKEPETTTE